MFDLDQTGSTADLFKTLGWQLAANRLQPHNNEQALMIYPFYYLFCLIIQHVLQDFVVPRIRKCASALGGSEQDANTQGSKISTMQFAAMRKQSTYTGHLGVTFSSLVYQLEGNRLVAFLNITDLIDIVGLHTDIDVSAEPPVVLQEL